MGFTPKRVTYSIDFEGTDLQGLEVTVRSLSLGEYLGVIGARRLADVRSRGWTDEDRGAMRELYDAFAGALVSWNVEDDAGDPVPATKEGVYGQDFAFMLPVALAWLNALGGGVDEDSGLGKDSDAGLSALEASIPMDLLSPSLPS